ncbi:hypothetical protein ANN_24423 [Periplaneta americana]|uniref:DUF659 domain-containing protein n=1 Tax=Periplaneta americana TaxID=6978 RepID=A0ABQ8S3A4_PERAM|nr:hypothetical protein ANN_24423 [Periplaneta americana]
MPKLKTSNSAKLKQFVSEYGDTVFSSDGTILYCNICEVKVSAEKRFTVDQHVNREKHKRGLQAGERKKQQMLLGQCTSANSANSVFYEELCQAFVSANIPFQKLNNNVFRDFLQKYTGKSNPNESTIRKNYIESCYNKTIDAIRAKLDGKKIWVSIDETTDCMGRYVVNIIVGEMNEENSGDIFLLNCEVLEKANFSTIAKLFDKSMNYLWPSGVQHDSVLLFLTDAAPHMVKAANSLKALYSKMDLLSRAEIQGKLAYIRSNFGFMPRIITSLEQRGCPMSTQIELVKSVVSDLSRVKVDVERTFSMYKSLLVDNRRSFKFENLQKVFVSYCNAVFSDKVSSLSHVPSTWAGIESATSDTEGQQSTDCTTQAFSSTNKHYTSFLESVEYRNRNKSFAQVLSSCSYSTTIANDSFKTVHADDYRQFKTNCDFNLPLTSQRTMSFSPFQKKKKKRVFVIIGCVRQHSTTQIKCSVSMLTVEINVNKYVRNRLNPLHSKKKLTSVHVSKQFTFLPLPALPYVSYNDINIERMIIMIKVGDIQFRMLSVIPSDSIFNTLAKNYNVVNTP